MHTQWRNNLESSGARTDGSPHWHIRHFGDARAESAAALSGNVVSDLSQYGLIRVGGEDARAFLHNQLTADLRALAPAQSRLAAWCNPKGRALALFRLCLREDAFLLRLPAPLLDAVQKRLQMFVLRSRVELADASEALVRMGVSGPDAAGRLEALLGEVPQAANTACLAGNVTVTRLPGPFSRFELLAPSQAMLPAWEALATDFRPVGEPAWRLLKILSGLPEVYPETREAFVPQMLNLHWLDGVDFRKGCYPGQEVVARMHYLGNLKRRLYLGTTDAAEAPQPGAPVRQADASQPVGNVVHAAPHPEGGCALLAVLRTEAAEAGNLTLETGEALELHALPYATPSRETVAGKADG